jgi:DNA polymerase-3 subunit delta'
VHVLPNDLEDKTYIIEDADKMTVQAQNALLLTLEEPPSFAHFFLLCNNAGALLETIRSRAPILRTEPVGDGELDEYICKHDRRAAQMKLSNKKEYAELIKCSAGGIGKALSLLEPKVWKPIAEQRALVSELVVSAIEQRGAKAVLPLLSKLSSKRDQLNDQLSLLSDALRDLILLKKSEDAPLAFYCDRNEAIELCDSSSLSFLCAFYEAVDQAIDENRRNANVRLAILKMATVAKLI